MSTLAERQLVLERWRIWRNEFAPLERDEVWDALSDSLEAERTKDKRIAELESAICEDFREGRAEVDKAMAQFGYDDLRFADVRHGWTRSTRRILRVVPGAADEALAPNGTSAGNLDTSPGGHE
jgi:hypothetical protein